MHGKVALKSKLLGHVAQSPKIMASNLADMLFLANMLFGGYDEIGGYAKSQTKSYTRLLCADLSIFCTAFGLRVSVRKRFFP